MSDIKVSVIMPVYNAAAYLRETMDSVCGQTLKEIEMICVDDGSTDESPAILEEYAPEATVEAYIDDEAARQAVEIGRADAVFLRPQLLVARRQGKIELVEQGIALAGSRTHLGLEGAAELLELPGRFLFLAVEVAQHRRYLVVELVDLYLALEQRVHLRHDGPLALDHPLHVARHRRRHAVVVRGVERGLDLVGELLAQGLDAGGACGPAGG